MTSNNKATIEATDISQYLSALQIGKKLLDVNSPLGIDKLKVVFPAFGPNPQFSDWSNTKVSTHEPFGATTTLEYDAPTDFHAEFRVGFKSSRKRGSMGWVEFNPSRMSHPDGRLTDVEGAVSCLNYVLDLAQDYVRFDQRPEQIALHRIDLTMDFAPVVEIQRPLYLATKIKPFLRSKPNVYYGPKTGLIESVTHKTRSTGSVLIYDKSVKEGWGTPTLRVEVQVSRRELKAKGPATLSEVSLEALRRLFHNRIASFAGLCIGSPPGQAQQILLDERLTKHLIKAAGLEYLSASGLALPKSDYFNKEDRKFKKIYPYGSVRDLL